MSLYLIYRYIPEDTIPSAENGRRLQKTDIKKPLSYRGVSFLCFGITYKIRGPDSYERRKDESL